MIKHDFSGYFIIFLIKSNYKKEKKVSEQNKDHLQKRKVSAGFDLQSQEIHYEEILYNAQRFEEK